MKIDDLTLQAGNDIPFSQARITIHQPTLKEIGYMGESNFHIGSHFLSLFNKDEIKSQDKIDLENLSNFDIFMSVMNSKEKAQYKVNALMILALLFPEAKIKIETDKILLQVNDFPANINKDNFEEFQGILKQIFCLGEEENQDQYNPNDALAKRIAEKIKKGKEKKAKQKDINIENLCIYSKYISILSVGLKKDKNELVNYTIPQLRDEMQRFRLKQDFDMYVKAKLAGAQDLEEVKNQME